MATKTVITPASSDAAKVAAFVAYLHDVREKERVSLAREIHDDLGSFLLSAAMDLGWLEQRTRNSELRTRLRRLGASLASAIDLKRDMIEKIRPTLLDNFGLFEALRWHFKHFCHHASAVCTDRYPAAEIGLNPSALSHIFRAAQTLLECTFAEEALVAVALEATISADALCICIGHEHEDCEIVDVPVRFEHEFISAAHRLAAFNGELSIERGQKGTSFLIKVGLDDVL